MISKQLVAASSAPLVLSILSSGESYGYAIIQQVRALSEDRLEWTEGMLYPVLHRLERCDWITSLWRVSETGRRRRYYRLTAKGRRALDAEKAQWMTVHGTLSRLWEGIPCST